MLKEKQKFLNLNMYTAIPIVLLLNLTGVLRLPVIVYFCYGLMYFYNNELLKL